MLDQRLRLFASQKEALSKLEALFFAEAESRTLILSGESGSGKSTVVQEFLNGFSGTIRGYTTVRHRSADGKQVAFQHLLLSDASIPLELTLEYPDKLPADFEYFLMRDETQLVFDRKAFAKLAEHMSPVQILKNRQPDLMLWDEVGGEELLVDSFYETLIYWLKKKDKPAQIIVWKKQHHKSKLRLAHLCATEIELLDKRRQTILDHPAVHIYDLDSENIIL